MSQKRPFVVDPVLTAIAIAYKNGKLIADSVMPRVDVAAETFKWTKRPIADGFTVPNTRVGRKSRTNQVETSETEQTSAVESFGLEEPIPNEDSEAATKAGRPDPKNGASEWLTNLVALGREVRVAGMTFDANNYAAAYKATLSGSDQWSHADSNPLTAMLTAMDGMIVRPTVAVFGQSVWTKVRTHPKVVSAILGNAGTSGVVTREQVAALLEVEEVLVGEAWLNSAKKGQTASLARAWGKKAALIYREKLATNTRGMTFGFTAEYGTKVAGTIEDPDMGLTGGVRVRVGERVKEIVTADNLGYLFTDAVA